VIVLVRPITIQWDGTTAWPPYQKKIRYGLLVTAYAISIDFGGTRTILNGILRDAILKAMRKGKI